MDPVGSAYGTIGKSGSGSVSISTKCEAELYDTFSKKFHNTVENIENYDTYEADKKDKTMFTGTAVNESKNSNMCKIWGRI